MKRLAATRLFKAALLLLMPLLFSSSVFAHNNYDNDHGNGGNGWDDHDWESDWDNGWRHDWDDWKRNGWGDTHNGKTFICHRTSSSRNPWVLIEVSSSARSTHYGHGDPVHFTDRGNGQCSGSGGGSSAPDPTAKLTVADEIALNTTTTATWTSTNATSCKLDGVTVATSGSKAIGPYSSTGYKTVTLTCTGAGGSDTDTETVKVVAPRAPNASLRLSNDEVYTGATVTATWSSTYATSCSLDGTTVATSGSAPVGPYSTAGYKTVTLTCTGAGGSDSDSESLRVKTAPVAPVVTLSLAPNEIALDGKAKLSWSATNATSCKLQGVGNLYSNSFTISIDDSGYYWKGPFYKAGTATYTVTCTGPGGTDSESITLTVKAPVTNPTVTLSLAANSIVEDTGTTTATFSSTNATSCTLNGTATSGTSGTANVGPYSDPGTQTITVTCNGAPGSTPATASKTLTVTAKPVVNPTVTLTLGASSLVQGSGQTLATWTSTNATSCTLNIDGTTSSVGTTNSTGVQVGPFSSPGNKTVSISCAGASGSTPATDSKQVNVTAPPAPTVDLSLAANSIAQNTGTTLATWTSANTTSCTLVIDGGTPILNASSGTAVGPFGTPGTKTVSISCAGAVGTTPATDSETVMVIAPPPAPTLTLTVDRSEVIVAVGNATASWTSMNTTSCKIGSADVGTSGTYTMGPYALGTVGSTQSITVICTGQDGSQVSKVASVAVVAAPLPPVKMCVVSNLAGGTNITYVVDYDVNNGGFSGQSADGQHITGSLEPKFVLNVGGLLVYANGSAITFEADGLIGGSRTGTSSFGAGVGSTGQAVFSTVDVYSGTTLRGTTTLTLRGSCNGLPAI